MTKDIFDLIFKNNSYFFTSTDALYGIDFLSNDLYVLDIGSLVLKIDVNRQNLDCSKLS